MKVIAFILFTCFTAYFAEVIIVPHSYGAAAKQANCCTKMKKDGCMKMHTAQNEANSKYPKGCTNASCVDCPLTYLAIPVQYTCITPAPMPCKKNYLPIHSHLISFYAASPWKPPKGA